MHEKVLFYTDQEFKLEIILQNRRIALGIITPSQITKNSKFTFSLASEIASNNKLRCKT